MKYFWLFLCFLITNILVAQTKIKGQVIDIDNSVPILSFSLGAAMTFQIRDDTGVYNFETGEGTIMLFDGRVEHRVLRQKHTGIRVNITFRKHL